VSLFTELMAVFGEFELEDVPGGQELALLCQDPVFRAVCRACRNLFPEEPSLFPLFGTGIFDADELGLTEDL